MRKAMEAARSVADGGAHGYSRVAVTVRDAATGETGRRERSDFGSTIAAGRRGLAGILRQWRFAGYTVHRMPGHWPHGSRGYSIHSGALTTTAVLVTW